jgi:hypothetical protein
MTRPKKIDGRSLFRPTNARLGVLEALANFGCGNCADITRWRLGKLNPTETQERQTRRILLDLRNNRFVRIFDKDLRKFDPVYGLTDKGVAEAKKWEMHDPIEISPEHSLLTFEHDLKRARTHEKIERLCDKNGWELFWQKSDLYRTVEPDDMFIITRPDKRIPFFYEEENKEKTFEELYEKVRRFFDYWDTDKCLKQWGYFRTFDVLFQFPTEARMTNFLKYLNGYCHCLYYRGKLKHTCLPGKGQKTIMTTNFLFTTDELIAKDIGGEIFKTPKDYQQRSYSLFTI